MRNYNLKERIIAIIVVFLFIFTQCGIGIAAPIYKVGQNLRETNLGQRSADAAGFGEELLKVALGNEGVISRSATGAAAGEMLPAKKMNRLFAKYRKILSAVVSHGDPYINPKTGQMYSDHDNIEYKSNVKRIIDLQNEFGIESQRQKARHLNGHWLIRVGDIFYSTAGFSNQDWANIVIGGSVENGYEVIGANFITYNVSQMELVRGEYLHLSQQKGPTEALVKAEKAYSLSLEMIDKDHAIELDAAARRYDMAKWIAKAIYGIAKRRADIVYNRALNRAAKVGGNTSDVEKAYLKTIADITSSRYAADQAAEKTLEAATKLSESRRISRRQAAESMFAASRITPDLQHVQPAAPQPGVRGEILTKAKLVITDNDVFAAEATQIKGVIIVKISGVGDIADGRIIKEAMELHKPNPEDVYTYINDASRQILNGLQSIKSQELPNDRGEAIAYLASL